MIIFLILLITIPAIAGEKESPGITITKGLTRKSYDGMDVDTVNKRFVDAGFTQVNPVKYETTINSDDKHVFDVFFIYNEEYEEYVCDCQMDEDDYYRIMRDDGSGRQRSCPYYRNGDEYAVVRKQI